MALAESSDGIDAHAHVFSAQARAIAGARYRPAYAARLEDWRACWGACGITRGVIVQVSFFGADNRELLAAIARDPARLRGVAIVDAQASLAELRSLDEGGVRALRLNLAGEGDYRAYGEARWRALYGRAATLGWHVEVFVDAGRLADIAPAMLAHDLPVIFDHFGNPGADGGAIERTFDAVAELAARKPVGCKLSGPYRLAGGDPAELARRWIAIAGPARLVWGSDWPWTRHEAGRDFAALHANVERWVGSEGARAVLWDNPARLYRFD